MNATTNEPAAACDYCGRENPDRLPACTGCGTPLVSAPPPTDIEPKGKSKGSAVALALLLGPLGLLYVRAWWPAFVMIVVAAPFIVTRTGGLWLTIGGRILCAVWAYYAVIEQDEAPNDRRDSARLLDEAARLESVDFSEAIAAYEEIVRRYPDSRASKQATDAIETLKKHA